MPRLLGIDLGTTSFKAVIYDEHGTALANSRVSPPDELISVDGYRVTVWRPEKLWDAVCQLIRCAVDSLPDRALDALAIAELGLVGYPIDSSGNVWVTNTASGTNSDVTSALRLMAMPANAPATAST